MNVARPLENNLLREDERSVRAHKVAQERLLIRRIENMHNKGKYRNRQTYLSRAERNLAKLD